MQDFFYAILSVKLDSHFKKNFIFTFQHAVVVVCGKCAIKILKKSKDFLLKFSTTTHKVKKEFFMAMHSCSSFTSLFIHLLLLTAILKFATKDERSCIRTQS
jgi:hypothetical protein